MRKLKINMMGRIISMVLVVSMTIGMAGVNPAVVSAKEPEVIVDETAYLMLEPYGEVSSAKVVKGCSMNGNSTIEDYGHYTSVTNMSTLDQPVEGEDGVTWNIKENISDKFYYEVVPEQDRIEVPWDFDISYQLNGVPVKADVLAGASGLIRIEVMVTPNTGANQYYQDNFIMMSGMMVDTEKNYSFRAEGAQTIALGNYEAALYVVMPGEKTSFSFEIGSDEFETMGVFMAMMPVTLSQLDDISEIKQHKKNLEDAGSAMNAILDEMFDMMSSMSGDLETTADGMDKLNEVRKIISSSSAQNKKSITEMKKSMKRMEISIEDLADYLDDSELSKKIKEMGDGFGKTVDSLETVGGNFSKIQESMKKIKKYLKQLKKSAEDPELQQKIIQDIMAQIAQMQKIMAVGSETAKSIDAIQSEVSALSGTASAVKSNGAESTSAEILQESVAAIFTELDVISADIDRTIKNSSGMIKGMNAMVKGMKGMSKETDKMLSELSIMMKDASDMMSSMGKAVGQIEKTVDKCSGQLNDGMKLTLDGMTSMMRNMVVTLKKTDKLKKNKDTITKVIRDEWKRLDKDLGILDIDTKAEKVSFTSLLNPEPRSLQMILRTEEICVPDSVEEAENVEANAEDEGILARLRQVIAKIFGE